MKSNKLKPVPRTRKKANMLSIVTAVGPATTSEQLTDAVYSVRKQVGKYSIEHILVFDGYHAARQLAKELERLLPSTFDSEQYSMVTVEIPASGQGIAKYTGVCKAKGQYLAFLDADDRFEGTRVLEEMIDKLKDTGAEIIQGSVITESGKFLVDPTALSYGYIPPILTSQRDKFRVCRVFDKPVTHGKIFDVKSTAMDFTFDPESGMCDEAAMIVKLMYSHLVTTFHKTVYYLADPPGSLSRGTGYEKLLSIRKYRTWAREFGIAHMIPLPDKFYRDACTDIELFGKHIIRIESWPYRKKFYLFGKLVYSVNVGL